MGALMAAFLNGVDIDESRYQVFPTGATVMTGTMPIRTLFLAKLIPTRGMKAN